MKYLIAISLALYSFIPLSAKDPAMKAGQKDAKKTAKQAAIPLKEKLCGKEDLGFSDDDLLPDADKGYAFDSITTENSFDHPSRAAKAADLQAFLKSSKRGEKIEENELFLVEGHSIIEQPESFIDILSLNTKLVAEEEKLETCQENGTYQIVFAQTLKVQTTPEIKKIIQQCNGHQKRKSYDSKHRAKNKSLKKEASFKENPDIASYHVDLDGNTLTSLWIHKENAEACDNFYTEEKITQQAQEEDFWNADNPEGLSMVESNPSCKLLYTSFPQGAETRVINGKAVARDAWFRHLYFSCEPSFDSKCARLRAAGGVLINKKCLVENEFGECDLWEKTYDLGKRGSLQEIRGSFKDDEIWGLENEFDTFYEKNIDFGTTITTLSIFSDLENTLKIQGVDFQEKLKIFNGEKLKCQKSFGAGNVFDCCKGMDGAAINVRLAGCSTQEKCLAENRKRGKCHFIGTQKVKLGTVTEHVFCCFPTKLARVVQEQGRNQLGMKWGTAGKPKCRGFSLHELQRIDFSKMDLSEVVDDMKIDKGAYGQKLKRSIDSLKTKVQRDIEQKRGKFPDKIAIEQYE